MVILRILSLLICFNVFTSDKAPKDDHKKRVDFGSPAYREARLSGNLQQLRREFSLMQNQAKLERAEALRREKLRANFLDRYSSYFKEE
jgi:hypothetical protein